MAVSVLFHCNEHSVSVAFMLTSVLFHSVWKKENSVSQQCFFRFVSGTTETEWTHTLIHARHTCSCALSMFPPQAQRTHYTLCAPEAVSCVSFVLRICGRRQCVRTFCVREFSSEKFQECACMPTLGHMDIGVARVCERSLNTNQKHRTKKKRRKDMWEHRSMYHWMQFSTVSMADVVIAVEAFFASPSIHMSR